MDWNLFDVVKNLCSGMERDCCCGYDKDWVFLINFLYF